jgi:hypothetical protein
MDAATPPKNSPPLTNSFDSTYRVSRVKEKVVTQLDGLKGQRQQVDTIALRVGRHDLPSALMNVGPRVGQRSCFT